LKELEKHLPKYKGITMQTVKEVVQSLVDDRIVNCEKIGTSNYFWAFPSAALHNRKMKLESLKAERDSNEEKIKKFKKEIETLRNERPETPERLELIKRHSELKTKLKVLSDELEAIKENDPASYEAKVEAVKRLNEDVNTWTDNLFAIEDYCVKSLGIERKNFKEMFSIPENLDYV
jgi:DNA repair exonuclease SbcCD ATPase subunit